MLFFVKTELYKAIDSNCIISDHLSKKSESVDEFTKRMGKKRKSLTI